MNVIVNLHDVRITCLKNYVNWCDLDLIVITCICEQASLSKIFAEILVSVWPLRFWYLSEISLFLVRLPLRSHRDLERHKHHPEILMRFWKTQTSCQDRSCQSQWDLGNLSKITEILVRSRQNFGTGQFWQWQRFYQNRTYYLRVLIFPKCL